MEILPPWRLSCPHRGAGGITAGHGSPLFSRCGGELAAALAAAPFFIRLRRRRNGEPQSVREPPEQYELRRVRSETSCLMTVGVTVGHLAPSSALRYPRAAHGVTA